jgi:uncharacterized protein with PQ loop repeat
MLLLPGADTPEQIAAAHGESFNAQELLGKAKLKYANLRVGENVKHSVEVAKPALSDLGTLLRDIVRLVSLSLAIFTSLIIAALTICWGVLTWALLFNNYHLPDQLSGISTIALLIAGIGAYYILLLPLVLVEQMFQRMGAKVRKNIAKPAFWALVVATLLWLVAAVSLIAVGISNQSLIKSYYDTHHNRPNTECIYNEPNIMYYPGNPVACPCNTNMLYGSRAVPCPLL